ncbi:hypothetical protein Scep_003096 [Stephania cephalantha]|uniref:J domain-containing protein n=1 Tax=Stephania cephalantha TaxID=152367 RepID=A0AAP0KPV1_9MAGN
MDHYKVLGLTKNASKSEIKDAFRKLALKFHPDRHSQSPKPIRDDATRQFKHISEAYQVLIHGRTRAHYNARSAHPHPTHYTHSPASRAHSKLGLDFEVAIKFLTTRAFLLNLAFASFLFGGAVVVERSADVLWKMQNSGKFDETRCFLLSISFFAIEVTLLSHALSDNRGISSFCEKNSSISYVICDCKRIEHSNNQQELSGQ